ncbi:MAG: hypothetical protein GX814_06230 [Microbacteriaceae bacterium]|nr:hypothetical protein [Microbacteriaceae bacterium]
MAQENETQLDLQLNALFATEATGEAPQVSLDPYGFSVLTICTGNICRSPLMAGLLRNHLHALTEALGATADFITVSSSGTGALIDAPADPLVLDLSRRLNTDLDSHRSRQFEPSHAENAHVIVTATRAQRDEITQLAPSVGSRCFTLVELADLIDQLRRSGALEAPSTPLRRQTRISRRLQRLIAEAHAARPLRTPSDHDDVEDPYRRSPQTHLRVAQQISGLCDEIADRFAVALGVEGAPA